MKLKSILKKCDIKTRLLITGCISVGCMAACAIGGFVEGTAAFAVIVCTIAIIYYLLAMFNKHHIDHRAKNLNDYIIIPMILVVVFSILSMIPSIANKDFVSIGASVGTIIAVLWLAYSFKFIKSEFKLANDVNLDDEEEGDK